MLQEMPVMSSGGGGGTLTYEQEDKSYHTHYTKTSNNLVYTVTFKSNTICKVQGYVIDGVHTPIYSDSGEITVSYTSGTLDIYIKYNGTYTVNCWVLE